MSATAEAAAGAGAGAGAGAPAVADSSCGSADAAGAAPAAAPAAKTESKKPERKAVHIPASEFSTALPPGPDKGGNHSYAQLPATTFNVRGKTYVGDSVKIPSKVGVADLLHVDFYKCDEYVADIASHKEHFIQRCIAAGDTRFFIAITFSAPGTPRTQMTVYYALPLDGPETVTEKPWQLLWRRFLKGDDEFRNARWKVIPRIAEGSWMVKRAVGTKPALLGQKLTHTFTVTDRYLDISCDVASSSVASVLVGMLQTYAKYLVIDLAFVIQGNDEEELPEHILGTLRINRPDLSLAPRLDEVEGKK